MTRRRFFRISLIRLPRHAIIPLLVKKETLPDCLEVTSWTEEGEIMALRHTTLPIEGVQFHPESIMTSHGKELLQNFIRKYSPSVTSC